MTGYILDYQGTAYSTDGAVSGWTPELINAHNEAVEQAELEAWERKPDLFVGYVRGRGRDDPITTWLGMPIGSIIASKQSLRRTRFGRLTYIKVKGTNGAYYRGSFGDNKTAVRLHRIGK